jgi:hypothetical protein
MQKSFKDRLAALEALEAAAEAEHIATGQVFDETDADALDDDELLAEAACGLAQWSTFTNILSFGGGKLSTARYWHPQGCAEERYWTRICERAAALCREQDIVIFPLVREDAIAALALVDAGLMTCRPLYDRCWHSHFTTICVPHTGGLMSDAHRVRDRLAHALDQAQAQVGGAFITDVAVLRAALERALGDMDDVPIQETA